MRDLADYQDLVVGWIEQWSNTDNNERDYLLASYIESLSQLGSQLTILDTLAKASDDPRAQALFR